MAAAGSGAANQPPIMAGSRATLGSSHSPVPRQPDMGRIDIVIGKERGQRAEHDPAFGDEHGVEIDSAQGLALGEIRKRVMG